MNEDSATSDYSVVVYAKTSTLDASNVYVEFQSNVIPQVATVRLYTETVEHATEVHADAVGVMPGAVQVSAVERALADPSHVELSREDHYVYVDKTTTNASGQPLRVPVKVVEGTSALVKTYFFATKEGNVTIVYERSNV